MVRTPTLQKPISKAKSNRFSTKVPVQLKCSTVSVACFRLQALSMGFCGQCGAQAAEGDKGCRSCGHKLPVALEGEVFCFACPAWCSSLVQWSQWNNICATGARASIWSTATASCGGGANRGEPTVAATNGAATRTSCKEAEDPH